MNIPESNLPRIVIVGGGFGGIQLAKKLRNKEFQVVLIDRHNYHTFQPLLYQVATAGLEPDSIAYPLRKIFEGQKNFYFRVANVHRVASDEHVLHTSEGMLSYDHLVLALGSRTNYFGNENIERYAMPMKTVPQALDLRSLLLQNFERALLVNDLEERESLMNFVIVGGGPTGTELAGALAELKNHVLPRDYPDLDIRRMNIHLIESAPRLLAAMSEASSERALKYIKKLGVHVWLNTLVTDYDGQVIETNTGKKLQSRFLIWAAGVQGAPIEGLPEEAILRGNRLEVDAFNRVKGSDSIYAIGDLAAMITEKTPKGHPMLAQPAIQQGQLLAKNLVRWSKNQEPIPFRYSDKGSMATIGRNKAVAELLKVNLGGVMAWLIWMFVHLMALVGFRNKMVTFVNWMIHYIQYSRDARLIIRPYKPKRPKPESLEHA